MSRRFSARHGPQQRERRSGAGGAAGGDGHGEAGHSLQGVSFDADSSDQCHWRGGGGGRWRGDDHAGDGWWHSAWGADQWSGWSSTWRESAALQGVAESRGADPGPTAEAWREDAVRAAGSSATVAGPHRGHHSWARGNDWCGDAWMGGATDAARMERDADDVASVRRRGRRGRDGEGRMLLRGGGRGRVAGPIQRIHSEATGGISEAQVVADEELTNIEAAAVRCTVVAETVADRLARELASGSYECMICLTSVGRQAAIWSCDQCWAVFHLSCISRWIERASDSPGPEHAWPCPGCRYQRVGAMPGYRCFCGRREQPEPSPHLLAHSCGEACGRLRPGCPHTCPELCHPGPCQRCPALGPPGACHCGAEAREVTRCGDPTVWCCRRLCGSPLSCGRHQCPLVCHAGPCPPCAETIMARCFCGAAEVARPCGQEAFSCNGKCGLPLACGHHCCERRCHEGECGPCRRDPATWGDRCACGKTEGCEDEAMAQLLVRRVEPRRHCADPLPLCGNACGRLHEGCGHACERQCHDDECGPCGRRELRRCRCRRSRIEASCSGGPEVLCTQICKTKKSCRSHRCGVACCPSYGDKEHGDHLCLQVCSKPLACGTHLCEDFCHLGRCPPCRVMLQTPPSCACGTYVAEAPARCGTQPPLCDRLCWGEMDCGHTCRARCHYGQHPLCYELVSRRCLGGHCELQNRPCHVGATPCGQACDRKLECGHQCAATCHAGPCPPCTQPCGAKRASCDHHCDLPCHQGSACPEAPCRRKVRAACACGRRMEENLCGSSSSAPRWRPPAAVTLKCNAACSRPRPSLLGLPVPEGTRYAGDFYQLALQHSSYVKRLEELFVATFAMDAEGLRQPQQLLICDSPRRFLGIEYAKLYWRLRATSAKDASMTGWWTVRVEFSAGARPPRPLLSELLGSPVADAGVGGGGPPAVGPSVVAQPRLRFVGIKGLGDDIYDVVGVTSEGFLGLRPGDREGEFFAFFDRGVAASARFRCLTGKEARPDGEAVPVIVPESSGGAGSGRSWARKPTGYAGGAASSGLHVALERTLGVRSAAKARPPTAAVPADGPCSGSSSVAADCGGQGALEPTPPQPPDDVAGFGA